MKVLDAEALVVGSGFGGAVVACRLAQAGFSVTILERGRRYPAGDAPNLPQDGALLPDERRWSWKLDQGLWDIVDLDEVVSVQAAGYGGGSLVYANVHLRPPRGVFDSAWPAVFRDRKGLDSYYDLVASMLEVAPVTAHPEFHAEITKSKQLESAVQNLGRQAFHPPLAIRYKDGPNAHGVEQRKCSGCGACCTGCPQSAKNTLDLNYLAIAERHKARVFTQFEVLELVERRDGTWLLRCFDHLEAQCVHVRSAQVFLCAGSIHTTELMARAQLLRDRPRPPVRKIQKRVGLGYFPGGDALGVVYETKHAHRPWVGPVISTAVVEWSKDKEGAFFMLQDGGYPERADRLVGLLRASALLHGNRLTRKGSAVVPPFLPPHDPKLGQPVLPFAKSRAASSLDQILDARAGGSFKTVVPRQLLGLTKRIAKRLSLPLFMSEVVREAIVRSLRHQGRWLGPLRSVIAFIGRLVARLALGPFRFVGARALRALLTGGGVHRHELAARIAGITAKGGKRRAVLLAMGRDSAAGSLHYDRKQRRLIADLNLAKLVPGYSRQEGLMTDIARQFGGELRTSPGWEFLHKPITVHNQGGCRMADPPADPADEEATWRGVTDPNGKVYGCTGLYILDGSVLCASVGVNPSATIAAIAERGVHEFLKVQRPSFPANDSEGGQEYIAQCEKAKRWAADAAGWDLEPPPAPPAPARDIAAPIGLEFKEELCGYYNETRVQPRDHESYLEQEARGRPHWPIELKLKVRVDDFKAFIEDPSHPMTFDGKITIRLPGDPAGQVGTYNITKGVLNLLALVPKDYALRMNDERADMQGEVLRSTWNDPGLERWSIRRGEPLRPERCMDYALEFSDDANRQWSVIGRKRIASTSSLDAWRQTATLRVRLIEGGLENAPEWKTEEPIRGAGAVHVDLCSFLDDTLGSVVATGTTDPTRQAWAVAEFTKFFFGTLQRIYLPTLRKLARRADAQRRLEELE